MKAFSYDSDSRLLRMQKSWKIWTAVSDYSYCHPPVVTCYLFAKTEQFSGNAIFFCVVKAERYLFYHWVCFRSLICFNRNRLIVFSFLVVCTFRFHISLHEQLFEWSRLPEQIRHSDDYMLCNFIYKPPPPPSGKRRCPLSCFSDQKCPHCVWSESKTFCTFPTIERWRFSNNIRNARRYA